MIAVWGIYKLSVGGSLPGGLDLAALQGSFIHRESVLPSCRLRRSSSRVWDRATPNGIGVAVAKRLRELSSAATKAVVRLRAASESLAGVVETVTFGNPTFKVNQKTIAVVDRYDERECLWLRVSANERELLLDQLGWFPSPYDPKRAALCCTLDRFDWRRLKPLLGQSYDLALSKAGKLSKSRTLPVAKR